MGIALKPMHSHLFLFFLASFVLWQIECQTRSREQLLEDLRQGSSTGKKECAYEIEGLDDWREDGVDDPRIKTLVLCDEDIIYDKTEKLSELKPFDVDEGIKLFADFQERGISYLVVDGETGGDFLDCTFKNLPPFKNGSLAPVVVNGERIKLTFQNALFSNNGGGYLRSGGIYVTGSADVEFLESEFNKCEGKNVGAIDVDENGEVEAEFSVFIENFGEEFAGAIHVHGNAKVDVEDCGFLGLLPPKDFIRFAKGEIDARPNITLPLAGAIALNDEAVATIEDSTFTDHAGQFGTLHSTHNVALIIRDLNFTGNYAESGGGLFIEGDYGNFARVTSCVFERNFARRGGGVVILGKGGMTLSNCDLSGNRALVGGGLYSDFVEPGKQEYKTCGKATEGSEIHLRNSRIIKNVAAENGGGVHSKCTQVSIERSDLHENSAGLYGGGIFLDTGVELDAEDSRFTQNSAQSGGAAVFVLNTTTVDAANCNITGNNVWGQKGGGALGVKNAEVVLLAGTTFSENTARGTGGGIWLKTVDELRIANATFANNSASDRGGALFADGVKQRLDMENSEIKHNSAGAGGGGFSLRGVANASISQTKFQNNSATADGGGIDISGLGSVKRGSCIIFDMPFQDNVAGLSCGGVRVEKFKDVEFRSLSVENNTAGSDGGGVCLENIENLYLEESTSIVANKAGGKGGGIHIRGASGLVELNSTAIHRNKANIGVALNVEDAKNVSLTNMEFRQNSAETSCGAIRFSKTENVEFVNLDFSGNSAGRSNGGALCLEQVNSFTSDSETSFKGNSAQGKGGAIFVSEGGALTFKETPFEANNATSTGGAIGGEGLEELSLFSVKFVNNTSGANGGGFGVEKLEGFVLDDVIFQENKGASSGGAFWATEGEKMTLKNTILTGNQAGKDGGGFHVEGFDEGEIAQARLEGNAAGENGGAFSTDGFGLLKIEDSHVEENIAGIRGGAFHLLKTNMESSELMLMRNEAEQSGGALLCEEESMIHLTKANFTHNFARAGQSLSALCACTVNVTHSVFLRERHRSNIGDFFKRSKKCGALITTLECEFFGGPLKQFPKWVLALIIVGGILLLLCCVACCFWRIRKRRAERRKAASLKKIEDDLPPSPIFAHPPGQAASKDNETDDEDLNPAPDANDADGDSLQGYNTENLASTDSSSYFSESDEENPRNESANIPAAQR